MKTSTVTLKNQLNAENIQKAIDLLNEKQGSIAHGETTMAEAYEGYKNIRSLLLECIDKGIYEEVALNRRTQINSAVQQIHQYSSTPTQFISIFLGLDDHVQLARLWEKNSKDLNISGQMKNLVALNRKMDALKKELKNISDTKEKVAEIYKASKDISDQHTKLFQKEKETNDQMEGFYEKTKILQERISENDQEIENKKKSILAFNDNIATSQKKLDEIFQNISVDIKEDIEERTVKAKQLILEAENALELNSTLGISMAYSERLRKLNEDKSKAWWLIGAGICLTGTVILGLMLTGFTIGTWSWGATENEAVIFGRIAMTGIGITAAVFCAKRYLYIKNLEEDYEYKVVLTKSILAFANKLKEIDPGKVAEYLNRVLIDLHQDPSRKRDNDQVIDNEIWKAFKNFKKNGQDKAKVE